MKTADVIAMVLVIIGGLNWGLVGFFDWDAVAALFGEDAGMSRVVYGLVGLAALYLVFRAPKFEYGRVERPEREFALTEHRRE